MSCNVVKILLIKCPCWSNVLVGQIERLQKTNAGWLREPVQKGSARDFAKRAVAALGASKPGARHENAWSAPARPPTKLEASSPRAADERRPNFFSLSSPERLFIQSC